MADEQAQDPTTETADPAPQDPPPADPAPEPEPGDTKTE